MTQPDSSDVHVNQLTEVVSKPFSGPNDSKLPSNVKDKSAKTRRQWVSVWNSSFSRAKREGKSTSEAESIAFRNANGVIKAHNYVAETDMPSPMNSLGLTVSESLEKAPFTADDIALRFNPQASMEGKVCGTCRFYLRAREREIGQCQLLPEDVEVPWFWTSDAYISAWEEALVSASDNYEDDEEVEMRDKDKRRRMTYTKEFTTKILKADDEKRIVTGPVLIPNTEDAQGDIVSKEEIEEAAHKFMIASQNIQRQHDDKNTSVRVVESSVLKQDTQIGNETMPEGTWIMSVFVPPEREDIWKAVKSGELTGFSIRGLGKRVEVT